MSSSKSRAAFESIVENWRALGWGQLNVFTSADEVRAELARHCSREEAPVVGGEMAAVAALVDGFLLGNPYDGVWTYVVSIHRPRDAADGPWPEPCDVVAAASFDGGAE